MTLRAGVYGRNSKGEAKSIADQLKLGISTVTEQGWTLAGAYSDDSSASRYRQKERDEWVRLLADLDAGAMDVLVLWKSARGSRDELEWFLVLRRCRDRGVRIHVMADRRTYDPRLSRDWKTLAEDGVNSAYYSEELSENVRRGVHQSAVEGGPHGRLPFGYVRHYDEHTGKFAEQIPDGNAPIVREIFERIAASCPISEIERDFQARQLPSPGGTWRRNTIRTIALNISYNGKRQHQGQAYPAKWPALIDDDLFWKVQEILGRPQRRTTRPGAAKYLLSYIGRSSCGGLLRTVKPSRPNRTDRYACERDGCMSISRADADDIVCRAILRRLSNPDSREFFSRGDRTAAARARAEAERYRVQLESARRSFELPDGISAEALARKERSLLPLIRDADRRGRETGAGVIDQLIEADDIQATWGSLPIAAQREAVAMAAEVVITPPTRRLSRHATDGERKHEALLRMRLSRWTGDSRLWGEIFAMPGDAP